MMRSLAVCFLLVAYLPAGAQGTRGSALYENHCQACHDKRVHDRTQRLPANIAELRFQVDRWQKAQNLQWSDEDIADVVAYLNSTQYKF